MDEEEIFLNAIEIATSNERFEFVRTACDGDEQLCQQVQKLLRHHEAAAEFLETSPSEVFEYAPADQDDTTGHWGAQDATPGLDPPRVPSELFDFCDSPGCLGRLGPYEILGVHGQGGMGTVFRARDPKLDRIVAIKMLATDLAKRPTAVDRLLGEARAAAVVRHRHVIAIYHVDDHGPLPYLVMELIQGNSLQQKIDDEGPLPPDEVTRIGAQIAAGLAAIHASGLVHRDIKPANILLDGEEQDVKITDFGLATGSHVVRDSKPHEIIGTPQYMAPEQARGEAADHRSDLYCLGGVLYNMCTGKLPRRADTALVSLRTPGGKACPPLRNLNPAIPPWLAELVQQLLEYDPDRRPQSASQIADLFRKQIARRASSSPGHADAAGSHDPPLQGWWSLIALTAMFGILAAFGLVVAFTRNGTTTRIEVPDGATVNVTADGVVEVEVPPQRSSKGAGSFPGTGRSASKAGDVAPPVASTGTVGQPQQAAATALDAATWAAAVESLPVQEQLQAVVDRLRELNPEFDGRLESTIEAGAVTGISLVTDDIRDISPLRALSGLRVLECDGSDPANRSAVSDLSALKGLQLTSLSCSRNHVSDIEPLRGMPLEKFCCADSMVHDLSPLEGMPLRDLSFQATFVSDLKPLSGMKLKWLNLSFTQVTDVSPIKGMPLLALYIDETRVEDLSPLRGMPLKVLHWRCYDYANQRHLEVVKSITSLEIVNTQNAAQFWSDLNIASP